MAERIFNLPDLGEGLTEAEIVEWLVEEGDEITGTDAAEAAGDGGAADDDRGDPRARM